MQALTPHNTFNFGVKFGKKTSKKQHNARRHPVTGMVTEGNAETLLIVLLSLFAQEIHVGFQQSDICPASSFGESRNFFHNSQTSMNSIQLPSSSGCLPYPQDMDLFLKTQCTATRGPRLNPLVLLRVPKTRRGENLGVFWAHVSFEFVFSSQIWMVKFLIRVFLQTSVGSVQTIAIIFIL